MYFNYKINNLVTIVKVQRELIKETWYDIPYPANFTAENSIVIPIMIGSTNRNYYILKLNFEKTKYSVANIINNSSDFAFDFIFIRQ